MDFQYFNITRIIELLNHSIFTLYKYMQKMEKYIYILQNMFKWRRTCTETHVIHL